MDVSMERRATQTLVSGQYLLHSFAPVWDPNHRNSTIGASNCIYHLVVWSQSLVEESKQHFNDSYHKITIDLNRKYSPRTPQWDMLGPMFLGAAIGIGIGTGIGYMRWLLAGSWLLVNYETRPIFQKGTLPKEESDGMRNVRGVYRSGFFH